MSFQTKVASRGFHISKDTTRENVNVGQEFSVQLETNEDWSILLWYIKTMVSGKLKTVGLIPWEVSRHTYFYIKEEGGRMVLFCQHAIVPHPSLAVELKYCR